MFSKPNNRYRKESVTILLLGTAVHNAAEVLQRRMPVEASASLAILEQCIGRLVAYPSPPRRLIAWVFDRYGKNALLPRAEFISQAGFAWALAQRLSRRAERASGLIYKAGRIPVGLERRLASMRLDMAGRADEIYWVTNGHVRIVDFKTGGIRDSDGNPKRNQVLQLAAYGLIVKELDPSVDITLELLCKSDQWLGKLDPLTLHAASQLLVDLRTALPRGQQISADGLACIGKHCGPCAYRPSCPAYRKKLESASVIDHGFFGFDICGTDANIEEESGFYAMHLSLRTGFAARISRIPEILFPAVQCHTGSQGAAFGIRSLEPARRGTLPQNFSIVDAQHPRNSAFQSFLDIERTDPKI